MQSIKRFFSESWVEIKHVNWPTRKEAARLTGVVIGMSLGIALFLGFFDYLFTYFLKTAITH